MALIPKKGLIVSGWWDQVIFSPNICSGLASPAAEKWPGRVAGVDGVPKSVKKQGHDDQARLDGQI